MDPNVAIAVIGGVFSVLVSFLGMAGSVVAAVIASQATSRREQSRYQQEQDQYIETNSNRLTTIETTLETTLKPMADFFLYESMRAAHSRNLVESNSPLQPTEKWHNIIPEAFRREIHEEVGRRLDEESDLNVFELMEPYKERLFELAIEKNYSIPALLGAIEVHIRTELRNGTSPKDCI